MEDLLSGRDQALRGMGFDHFCLLWPATVRHHLPIESIGTRDIVFVGPADREHRRDGAKGRCSAPTTLPESLKRRGHPRRTLSTVDESSLRWEASLVNAGTTWPPSPLDVSELPSALCVRLDDAGVPGIRTVSFLERPEGLEVQVAIFPLTRAVADEIRRLCEPFPANVTEGSEQLPRRC